MADPIKLVILKKVTAMLESMSVADGYSRDYAGIVFRGRQLFGDDTGATAISIVEYPRPDAAPQWVGDNEGLNDDWQILIQGWTKSDSLSPTDPLYPMLDDVESMMYRTVVKDKKGDGQYPEYRFDGLAAEVKIGPGIVRAPDQTSNKAFFYLPVRIRIARQAGL